MTTKKTSTLGPTQRLAAFASALKLDDLPTEVLQRVRDCLIDTVAISLRGAGTEWSRIILDYVRAEGFGGRANVLGQEGWATTAGLAGLANGVLAHALELDSLRKPGAGVHPGAVVVPAALAVAQEVGASGRALLEAIATGLEVLLRIGVSTHHSAEPRGFHAPGLTGPFGAAAAAARLYGLDANHMTAALGIAGSTASGLMQFSVEGHGAMVKRLHIGRAVQSGIQAAQLSRLGFSAPRQILEGKKGFLQAFCSEYDIEAISNGLGKRFETELLCFKRYPCHITAHTPVYAIEMLRCEVGLAAADVTEVEVIGTDRMATSNSDPAPTEPALANYSIPFCVAAALTAEPDDPATFDASRLADPTLRELSARVRVVSDGRKSHSDWQTRTLVTCRDGRIHERTVSDFPGTPAMPLSASDLRRRFRVMTGSHNPDRMAELFGRLTDIENSPTTDWIQ